MSVLVEAWSVIIPNDTLNRAYPNGVAGYASDCPNATFCTDGSLTRVGFMDSAVMDEFVNSLSEFGLIHLQDGLSVDIAVINQLTGFRGDCTWIDGGTSSDGYGLAWLRGSPQGDLAAPPDWSPDESMRYVADLEEPDRMQQLYVGESIEASHDNLTGETVYTTPRHRGHGTRLMLVIWCYSSVLLSWECSALSPQGSLA